MNWLAIAGHYVEATAVRAKHGAKREARHLTWALSIWTIGCVLVVAAGLTFTGAGIYALMPYMPTSAALAIVAGTLTVFGITLTVFARSMATDDDDEP